MFPEIDLIDDEFLSPTVFNGTAFLYDFQKGDFIYKNGAPILVKGKEALNVWIEKIIRTEKFRFGVHKDTEYGVTIDDLIGGHFPRAFTESEISREITESLLKNEYIKNVSGWLFNYVDSTLEISFTVETDEEIFNYTAVI